VASIFEEIENMATGTEYQPSFIQCPHQKIREVAPGPYGTKQELFYVHCKATEQDWVGVFSRWIAIMEHVLGHVGAQK